jgi:hypothetical protein
MAKGEKATVKNVICDEGLDNGLSQFGTEQLACNLTRYKEELDIHVEDQPDLHHSSPFEGWGWQKRRNGYLHYEEGEGSDLIHLL